MAAVLWWLGVVVPLDGCLLLGLAVALALTPKRLHVGCLDNGQHTTGPLIVPLHGPANGRILSQNTLLLATSKIEAHDFLLLCFRSKWGPVPASSS